MRFKTGVFLPALAIVFGASVSAGAQQGNAVDQVAAIAGQSQCARIDWPQRGQAPRGYIQGVAVVFARSVCQSGRADARVVSAARGAVGSDADRTDAMTWYDGVFTGLGMSNAVDGVDTLRHAYTLLIGLGMRESSGKHCVGRDRSADFSSASSAEAGIFQTSWGVRTVDPTLPAMFERYKANQSGCLLDLFSKRVTCSAWDARTWGEGDGADWQKLTKACPAFATEYAAVVLRKSGGRRGEFGPIRNRAAAVRPECDAMLKQVQTLVQGNPQLCSQLQ